MLFISFRNLSTESDFCDLNAHARGDDANSEQAQSGEFEERRQAFQRRLASEVTALLEKSVGLGKVKVTVNADLDFDRVSTTEETFDPDGQVLEMHPMPFKPSNCTFGDDDLRSLYVTAGGRLYRTRTERKGYLIYPS